MSQREVHVQESAREIDSDLGWPECGCPDRKGCWCAPEPMPERLQESARGFVPFWCRVGAHRWRVATLQLKGTCQCDRCGKLKGAGA